MFKIARSCVRIVVAKYRIWCIERRKQAAMRGLEQAIAAYDRKHGTY